MFTLSVAMVILMPLVTRLPILCIPRITRGNQIVIHVDCQSN